MSTFRGCPLSNFSPTVSILDANSSRTGTESLVRSRKLKAPPKRPAGRLSETPKLENDGKTDKEAGKILNAVGGLNDAVRDAVKKP